MKHELIIAPMYGRLIFEAHRAIDRYVNALTGYIKDWSAIAQCELYIAGWWLTKMSDILKKYWEEVTKKGLLF